MKINIEFEATDNGEFIMRACGELVFGGFPSSLSPQQREIARIIVDAKAKELKAMAAKLN